MKNWKINDIEFECVSYNEWQAKRNDNQVIVLYIFEDIISCKECGHKTIVRKSRVEIREKGDKGWFLASESKLEDSPEIALREALKEE